MRSVLKGIGAKSFKMKKLLELPVKEVTYDAGGFEDSKTSIPDVIKQLQEFSRLGATHIRWKAKTDLDGDSQEVTLSAMEIRLETEQEYSDRLAGEEAAKKKAAEVAEAKARQQYAELKKRFGY